MQTNIKICPPEKRTRRWISKYKLLSTIIEKIEGSNIAIVFHEYGYRRAEEILNISGIKNEINGSDWAREYALEIINCGLINDFFSFIKEDPRQVILLAPRKFK